MAGASCDSEMAPSLSKQGQSMENLVLSELATCWDGCRFCMCWSVDILSETMCTLWRETSSCTSLRAVHTAFSSAWKDAHHLPAGIVH